MIELMGLTRASKLTSVTWPVSHFDGGEQYIAQPRADKTLRNHHPGLQRDRIAVMQNPEKRIKELDVNHCYKVAREVHVSLLAAFQQLLILISKLKVNFKSNFRIRL